MHKKTEKLKSLVKKCSSYEEFLNRSRNFYKGEDCYVFCTGPSFNDYDLKYLKSKVENKLVFSIKKAYLDLTEETDFHFFNCCNMPVDYENIPYRYTETENRPIVIASSNYPLGYRWSKKQPLDLFLKIPLIEEVGKHNCLCFSKNYENYTLQNSNERPVGPGILYETVLYLAVHLGVSSINTLGFDLRDPFKHFYSCSEQNTGAKVDWEAKAINDSLPSLKSWLEEKGISIKTFSKSSAINDCIERFLL